MQTSDIRIGGVYAYYPSPENRRYGWDTRVFMARALAVRQELVRPANYRAGRDQTVTHRNGVRILRLIGYDRRSTNGREMVVLPNTLLCPWDDYAKDVNERMMQVWIREAEREIAGQTAAEMAKRLSELTGAKVSTHLDRVRMKADDLAKVLGTLEASWKASRTNNIWRAHAPPHDTICRYVR